MIISNIIKKYPVFAGRILFWNIILFVVVKLVLPHSTFQLASLIDTLPVFDSREIIYSTNEARAAAGLAPLRANAKLDVAASQKLNDMAVDEYFAHVSPDGIDPWFWLKEAQYKYSVAGENLAIGFFSAKDTVGAWLNSPSHKANIMNGQYQEIGVAVKGVKIGDREGILVVQMFGRPLSQGIPAQVTRQPSPSPSSQVIALVSPGVVKAVETTAPVQTMSTDINIPAPVEPVAVTVNDSENLIKVSDLLNGMFTFYAFGVVVLSVLAFLMFERNKSMALRMSLNVVLFLLALSIPALTVSFKGFIF